MHWVKVGREGRNTPKLPLSDDNQPIREPVSGPQTTPTRYALRGALYSDTLLATRPERHRYVFFMSPLFQGNKRLPQFEQSGVQVWSVDV